MTLFDWVVLFRALRAQAREAKKKRTTQLRNTGILTSPGGASTDAGPSASRRAVRSSTSASGC